MAWSSPDSFMEYLAMIDNADEPATSTTWLEEPDDEAQRTASSREMRSSR